MELRCPHCNKVFQVDESGYAQIAQQVRDIEFQKELERRTQELEEKQQSQIKVVQVQQQQAFSNELAQRDALLSEKEMQIQNLQAQLVGEETKKRLAINEAVNEKNAIIQKLNAELENKDTQQKLAITKVINEKDGVIQQLNTALESKDTEQKLAISEAIQGKEKELSQRNAEIVALQGQLQNKVSESQLREKALQEKYNEQLKAKDEQIAYYKDFKAKQSTKMIGESLEQHCLNSFNSIRMTAFPNAYFDKDNDARTGSKGDFIFKESKDGIEFLSIMFECKNEADETATKHKNEDFFKELDKDRREKGCEYAVLVSMLEMDNDFYNNGIVDVSYRYPKMYVIRPQFFIPIITLLRNAALNSLQYQQELAIVRNQQLDLNNFEENMRTFKDAFARNYRLASERFATAIEEIDKTILHLQKTREALLSSENNLRLANNKAEDLSIKKLTKNAPSIKALFEAQAKERGGEKEQEEEL